MSLKNAWSIGFIIHVAACSGDFGGDALALHGDWEATEAEDSASMTLEEFKARAYLETLQGRNLYRVEGDILMSEERVEAYYYDVISAELDDTTDKSTVVRQAGVDDLFSAGDKVNITYCVADSWGTSKPRALVDMREATSQWMAAGNVVFTHVPSQDDDCADTNTGVLLNVLPWSGGGLGCYPYDCRHLMMNYAASFGHYTWLGAWTHEVGHTLGLAHEHVRTECGVVEPVTIRGVNSYDVQSAMHYDTVCGSVSTGQTTALDRSGLASLYGAPGSTALRTAPSAWIMSVFSAS